MKGLKKEILTRPKSRHSSRPDVFYFLPTAHFLKQLPTHIAHIAKAPQANAATKACQRVQFLPAFLKFYYTFAKNKLGVPNFKAEIIPFIPDQDNTCVGK